MAVALIVACLSARATAAPTITFDGKQVVASGVTAGGTCVLFGVTRERAHWPTRVVTRQSLQVDSDGDGRVELEVVTAGLANAVWAVVDLTTGGFATASPDGIRHRRVPFAPGALATGRGGGIETVREARELLEVLVARPGPGLAWRLSAGDGGLSDADGTHDGALHATLGRAWALGTATDRLAHLVAGDVIIAIDPNRMEILAEQVGAPR